MQWNEEGQRRWKQVRKLWRIHFLILITSLTVFSLSLNISLREIGEKATATEYEGGGKSGKKRYDHLLRIRSIFISYYSRHSLSISLFLSLSLLLSMHLCGKKDGDAGDVWG